MKTEHRLICNNKRENCRSKKDLIKISWHISKKTGNRVQYYRCGKCNTKRMRKYVKTKNGKEKVYNAVYKSMKKYNTKQNARVKLNYHIKKGNVTRPSECVQCNKKCKPNGHHTDYSKPLDVVWVCRRCHFDMHKLLRSKK